MLEVFTLEGFTSRYYLKSFTSGKQPLDLSILQKKFSVWSIVLGPQRTMVGKLRI